ncbi:MAG: hypothetical protein K2X43_07485 [Hyphomonadaceae bacterium]|jgi:hypothetical protein|nr:hypothetical protein [Hyphomonadaceae bacterium]
MIVADEILHRDRLQTQAAIDAATAPDVSAATVGAIGSWRPMRYMTSKF